MLCIIEQSHSILRLNACEMGIIIMYYPDGIPTVPDGSST